MKLYLPVVYRYFGFYLFFTCILSVKHSNFASFYCLHIECVSTACVSTILEMCKPVCQSCVGVSCGCQGEISNNRIKLNKGPEFSQFSHYKNLIDKLFYFLFAIVSLSV